MFLSFGINRQGKWVDIRDVPSGRSQLHCPYCHQRLIAKKGQILEDHFAHDGPTCQLSKAAADATQLPMWDRFELLDSDERKYLERRQQYKHRDIFSWMGMHDAVLRLERMNILSIESTTDAALVKTIEALRKTDPDLLNDHDRPSAKLEQILKALSPLSDLRGCWKRATKINQTSIERTYHANKLEKQHSVEMLAKAQCYWFDCFARRQAFVAPEFMGMLQHKVEALGRQSLYVMQFTGDFTVPLPASFIKIGITTRAPSERLAEVMSMLDSHGQNISGNVLANYPGLGRLERPIHYFFQNELIALGNHREFFSHSIADKLLHALGKVEPVPYQLPADLFESSSTEIAAVNVAGRKAKTAQQLLEEYPDIVAALRNNNGGIRPTAKATGRAVNTVQKVKAAMADNQTN